MAAKIHAKIHPTAIVAPGAELDGTVEVGAYSVIGEHVRIAAGCRIGPHAVIEGHTEIGPECTISPFASVGGPPQDKKFAGESSTLRIGARNVIREYVTLHPGTAHGTMKTEIGDDNLFMVSSHVAHDCRIGNENVIANGVALAGHVEIGNRTVLGGLAAVHQFTRVGSFAMIGGGAMVNQDVPPGCIAQGDRAVLRGLNTIGLRRGGFDADEVSQARKFYRELFLGKGRLQDRIDGLPAELRSNRIVANMLAFIASTQRGIAKAGARDDGEGEA